MQYFENLLLFEIAVFWKFVVVRNWTILKIWCFLKLKNFGNFKYFIKCKFFEFATLQIFGIFKIEIFFNFPNWKFFEFFKLEVFGIVQIGKLGNFKTFSTWKIKVWLQKLAILELFVHSIFRTTRNFSNSHISTFFHILVEIS